MCLLLLGFVWWATVATAAGLAPGSHGAAPIRTEVRQVDGVPVLTADGEPFTLKVWTAGLHLASQTNAQVRDQIDWAAGKGFNAVEIMAEWRLIEPIRGVRDWARVDELMDYAASRGLFVFLTIEAGYAPPWFADELYPGAVFVTYDPDPQDHPGMISGRLSVAGEGSLPVFYHPGYWAEADSFIEAAIERYRGHPALFGYDLFVFTSGEFNYPGGGAFGIAGFADYSDYTRGLYGSEPPLPLVGFSQAGPDTRPEWSAWMRFRVDMKRRALDHFGELVKRLDSQHVLVAWLGNAALWGGWDNGYTAEASGGDYPYLITRPYIDVVRVAPQVRPDLFQVRNGRLDPTPYVLVPTIRAAQRHGKVVLLQTERATNDQAPDVTGKITAWAAAFQSLGVQFLWWQEPEGERDNAGSWTGPEKAELTATLGLADLPAPERIGRSEFAFVDLQFETGRYYADNTYGLLFSVTQAQAFLDAGLPYDTLSAEEILADPSVLSQYRAIGFVIPEAYDQLASPELKSIIATYEEEGGVVWRGDPVDGFNYLASGYADTTYLDSLRAFADAHGIARHRYSGYGLQIWGSKPYLFVLSRSADFEGTLEVAVPDWGLSDGPVTVTGILGDRFQAAAVAGGALVFDVALSRGQPTLFVVRRYSAPRAARGRVRPVGTEARYRRGRRSSSRTDRAGEDHK